MQGQWSPSSAQESCPPPRSFEEELIGSAVCLCKHPYGNFILQRALEHGSPEQRRRVVAALCPEAPRLARHTIASNVLRCALVHGSRHDRHAISEALTADAKVAKDRAWQRGSGAAPGIEG